SVHAESTSPDVAIFSVDAKICQTGMVTGLRSFQFSATPCSPVPIGQGEVEQQVLSGGGKSMDLQMKVGVGHVDWLTTLGVQSSLTCGPGSNCDMAIQVQITNGTVYYNAPLCFGTNCPPDPSAPPPPANNPP